MTLNDKKGDTAEFDINSFLSDATRENDEAMQKERVVREEKEPVESGK